MKIGQKEGLCSPEIVGVRHIGGHKRDIYKIHKGLVRTLDFLLKLCDLRQMVRGFPDILENHESFSLIF